MRRLVYVMAILILLTPALLWAESYSVIRCGSKSMGIGSTIAAVLVNCGKPLYTTIQTHTNTTTLYNGNTIVENYSTEIWLYKIGDKNYAYTITFYEGKIVEIERER